MNIALFSVEQMPKYNDIRSNNVQNIQIPHFTFQNHWDFKGSHGLPIGLMGFYYGTLLVAWDFEGPALLLSHVTTSSHGINR
jgi:hypothetical protein